MYITSHKIVVASLELKALTTFSCYQLASLYNLICSACTVDSKCVVAYSLYFTAHFSSKIFSCKEKSVVNMYIVYLDNNTTLHFASELGCRTYVERYPDEVVKVENTRRPARKIPEGMRTPRLVMYGIRRPVAE